MNNPWFIQTCCKASPQTKNVEKLGGQLKFKVTDLGPCLHKLTGQFLNWPKRAVLSYLIMQVLFVISFKYYFTQVYWGKKIIGQTEGRLPNFYKGRKNLK